MWDPQHLTTLQACTACYMNSHFILIGWRTFDRVSVYESKHVFTYDKIVVFTRRVRDTRISYHMQAGVLSRTP
jgi:hypothetical protein